MIPLESLQLIECTLFDARVDETFGQMDLYRRSEYVVLKLRISMDLFRSFISVDQTASSLFE